MMPKLFDKTFLSDVSCFTIFLGANDCALQECLSGQHVPINEYKQNLEDMIEHLEANGLSKDKVVLITPPIYFHDVFVACRSAQGLPPPLRDDAQPIIYAAACIATASKLGVGVVDANSAFAKDSRQQELFCDGLHFSPAGAELLYSLVLPEIEARVKKYRNEKELTMNYPYWADINRDNPSESL